MTGADTHPVPDWQVPETETAVVPDVKQALAFFAALFPSSGGASIHFRGVAEPADGRTQQNLHYALDENFADNLKGFLEWCHVEQRAAFFLPGIVKGQGTGKDSVLSLPAILVDFDKGDASDNLAQAESVIGTATIVVESGGQTDQGPKLHAYWRLATPASDQELGIACATREHLAIRFGGDRAFKQAAQVIRVPGSIHFKGTPKLVQLRAVRPGAVYALKDIAAKVGPSPQTQAASSNPFDLNAYRPVIDNMDRALTEPTREGAVDDLTRFEAAGKVIGHYIRMVREGRMTPDECWHQIVCWNAAEMRPPWDEARLRKDFERLARADIEARGPLVKPEATLATGATGRPLRDWGIKKFAGPAPERNWLVEGLIPLGTAGVLSAPGGAGKSMLALQLALHVGTASAPDPSVLMDFSAPKFFGHPIVARGAAVVLTAEDDADEVHRRIATLDPCNLRNDDPEVYVRPMLSDGGPRAIMADGPAGPQPTDFWRQLRAELLDIPNLRLVVLDPLSHFASANLDKDNRAGAALMSMLGTLATETGAAIMLVHHMTKNSEPENLAMARGAIRGASSLVDNGRWALALWEASNDKAYSALKPLGQEERAKQEGVVYFGGLAKGNAPGAKTVRTLVRNASTGLLQDVTDQLAAATPKQAEVDAAAFAALSAHAKNDPRFSFTAGQKGLWQAWHPVFVTAGVSVKKAQVEGLFERLLVGKKVAQSDARKGGHALYEVVHEV